MNNLRKPVTLHIEVSHDRVFARYIVKTHPSEEWKNGATQINQLVLSRLPPSRRVIARQVIEHVSSCSELDNYEDIWFKQVPDYITSDGEHRVSINDTDSLLFNIPINLMLLAACTDEYDVTYYDARTQSRIARLIRCATSVNVHPYDGVAGAHACTLRGDYITVNQINPRTIQFNNLVQLIHCVPFKDKITNGNLLLAFADAYNDNLDDDIININDVIPNVEVVYDQFTGNGSGNLIELNSLDLPGKFQTTYEANKLDSGFVEFLEDCIKCFVAKCE